MRLRLGTSPLRLVQMTGWICINIFDLMGRWGRVLCLTGLEWNAEYECWNVRRANRELPMGLCEIDLRVWRGLEKSG